ncbi:MAG: FliM/FliN family flagellar motor switch protein [Armatimonadetes bacterium]|nr:FliM/FliN family flagellar motor switch protein [Armatimonadota bacterium]
MDALNQDEINALLETFAATGGQESGSKTVDKQVKIYDFARPDKFSKDHLRALNSINMKHGVLFAAAMGAALRVQARADLLALDQLTYREYCASVPENTLFVEVDLKPLTSTAVFEFNPLLVSIWVDLLAGGVAGTGSSVGSISDIDKAIVKSMVELVLRQYIEAWGCCLALKPSIVSMSTESSMRQILLPSEAVLISGYEVSVGETVSMMSICLPASAIEPVLPALTMGRTLNAVHNYDAADPALVKSFEGVLLDCKAVLGRTSLSFGELADLEVGDLIKLPMNEQSTAEFWVGNVAAFRVSPGVAGNKVAIKIENLIDITERQ